MFTCMVAVLPFYSHVVISTRVWRRLEPGAALMNSIVFPLKYSLLLQCRCVLISEGSLSHGSGSQPGLIWRQCAFTKTEEK